MTVYLIAQPTVSTDGKMPKLEPLAKWGNIRVLINPGEDPRFNPSRAFSLIQKRLADFNPAEDYLVWAGGDTLAAVMTGVVLADMSMDDELGFDHIRWLRWERGRDARGRRTDEGGHYACVTIPLPSPINPNDATLPPSPDSSLTTER